MGTIKMKETTQEQVNPSLADAASAESVDVSEKAAYETEFSDAAVLYEDVGRTNENSRLYYLNNNTAKSIVSSGSVNYYDETANAWKKIDNTFVENGDRFEAKARAYKTEIFKAEKSKSVKMSKGDKNISWTYLGKQNSDAPFDKARLLSASLSKSNTLLRVDNCNDDKLCRASNRAVYENATDDTDLEYCLQGNNLKENIIVKEKSDDYRYLFSLDTQGLEMRLSDDNAQIEFYSKDKVDFTIPAPYMYDSAGAFCDEVYYELESSENGSYKFAVVASENWINANERKFPVTIDPQITVGVSDAITKQVEYCYYSSSSSSGANNWSPASFPNIKVYNDGYLRYRTVLTIKKSAIDLYKNKASKVVLRLLPSKNGVGSIKIDGSYKNCSGLNAIECDLTQRFNNASGNVTVYIEPNGGTNAEFYADVVLEIEYLTNEKIKPCVREFALTEKATGYLDVSSGEFTTEIPTASGEGLSLPYGISHIFKRSSENFGCGKNMRLNLHEKLEKIGDSLGSEHIYTDSQGNKHGFKERFYYLNSQNKKVDVNKSNVRVATDGTLTDSYGNKVFKEEILGGGWKAVTRLDGVKNIEIFEQRQDEIKQLSEQVSAYKNTLNEFVIVDQNGNVTYSLKNYLSSYEGFKIFTGYINASNFLMTESEALNFRSMLAQKAAAVHQEDSYETQLVAIPIQSGSLNISQKSIGYQQKSVSYANRKLDSTDDAEEIGNNSDIILNLDSQSRNIGSQLGQLKLQEKYLRNFESDSIIQQTLIDEQISYIKNKKSQYKTQIEQYYKEYANKLDELELRKKYAPVHYLTDGETVKGFNENGDLVAIADSYENTLVIERDKKNRITRVYDDKEKEIRFEYNNAGELVSLTDVFGKRTTFGYAAGNLESITFFDGETLGFERPKLTTNYYGELISNITSSRQSLELEYDGTRLSMIFLVNKIKSIDRGAVTEEYTGASTETVNITYGNKKTTVSVSGDVASKEIYDFDASGNLSGYTAEENGVVVKAEKYDYEKYVKDNVRYAKKDTLKKTPLSSFAFVAGEYTNITLNDRDDATKRVDGGIVPSVGTSRSVETYYEYDDNDKLIKEAATVTTQYSDKTDVKKTVKAFRYNSQGKIIYAESYVKGEENVSGKTVEETVYDDKGKIEKSFTYNTLDASSKVYSQDNSEEEKERAISVCDEHGNVTAITQSTESGEENSTQTQYTCGKVTKVTSGNNTVEYSYDHKGRKTAVYLNSETPYVTYAYSKANGENTAEATLANGKKLKTKTDKFGNVTQTSCGGQVLTSATYENANRLKTLTDGVTGKTATYSYDELDKAINISDGVVTETAEYNADGNLSKKTVKIGDAQTEYVYAYKNNYAKDLQSVSIGNISFVPQSDCLGRNTGKVVSVGNAKIAEESISYRKTGDKATTIPSAMRYGEIRNGKFVLLDNIKYAYDTHNNITEIKENGQLAARYIYDDLDRLIREDNKQLKKTTLYSYDNNGNILNKREFAFTLCGKDKLEELDGTSTDYAYNGDKLLSYGSELYEYDILGNPTMYRGKSVTWTNGRQMTAYDGNTFAYDGRGRRTGKNAISFTYDSAGNLLKQSNGLEFIYDNSGVAGVVYNNSTYFYRRNVQGDIIALLDNTGAVVVKYVYDAWGNHEVRKADGSELTDSTHIGNLNPFRYRGYYYDAETGLYFLKTRYYDPTTCRFVTIDDLSYLDPETINGLNLYAYCANNPVMAVDPEGTMPKWLRWLLGGLIIIAAVALSILTAGIGTVITGALGGGVFATVLGGAVGGAISGAVMGFGISVATQGITNGFENINWNQVGIGVLSGAIVGAVTGAITSGIKIAQAAKMWDSGTFKSGYQSMKYHYAKHGADFKNIIEYTKSAVNFANRNASMLQYTFNYKYGNALWRFSYTNGIGGIFTSMGKIVSFWLK